MKYEVECFASSENKMFHSDIHITVDTDNESEARNMAMDEIIARLDDFGIEVEVFRDSYEVVAKGIDFEDSWYGFNVTKLS